MGSMTIKDIAKKCGVGISTVSRALNNHSDISPETREKILRAVAESDFVPNNSARNVKWTESKASAILVKEIDNPVFATMMRVMEQKIRKEKYSFFIQHMGRHQDEVEAAMEIVEEKRVRGIIFLGGDFRNKSSRISRIKVPFVVCSARLPEVPKDCAGSFVTIDDREESRKMVDYLCSQGHEKIVILASDKRDENIGKMRLEGYMEALRANNIKVQDKLIRHLDARDTSYSMENGYRMMKELIEEKTEFTAVFAISDMMVIGACKALLEAGRKIPKDVAAAGFDGLSYTDYFEPSITTMAQPVEELAGESVESLFEMIETKKSREGKILPADLKIRKSTLRR